MATLHGFPVLLTGKRWCVVDMPDFWAIMDSLDTVPRPVFRFQKDESGWRDAVAQLQRSDTAPPIVPTVVAPVAPPPVRRGRRQFSLARLGILLGSVVLGVSAWLPWATIPVSFNGSPTSSDRGDLFKIMSHGWRNSVAEILVGLAVICAIQALVLPFPRIALASAVIGFLSLVPVIIGATQIHTYTGTGFSHPPVSIGYGVFVAFGGCLLLIMAWAVFPSGLRRPRKRAGSSDLSAAGPVRTGPVMEGLTPLAPPAPAGTGAGPPMPVQTAARTTAPTQDAVTSSGLPTLGAALAQLAEQDLQEVDAPPPAVTAQAPPAKSAPELHTDNTEPVDVHPVEEPEPANADTAEEPEPVDVHPVEEPEPANADAAEEPEPVDVHPVEEPEPANADTAEEPEPVGTFPPGWYADYADSSLLRYWDGGEWTDHTHPAGA